MAHILQMKYCINICILIKILQKFIPNGSIDNKSPLV